MARQLLQNSPEAMALTKQVLWSSLEVGYRQASRAGLGGDPDALAASGFRRRLEGFCIDAGRHGGARADLLSPA